MRANGCLGAHVHVHGDLVRQLERPVGPVDLNAHVRTRSHEGCRSPRHDARRPQLLEQFALVLYRFAEAQLLKLVTPFLLDPRDVGGLGLRTQDVGIAYGTVGIIALTLGGLLGGWVISRNSPSTRKRTR